MAQNFLSDIKLGDSIYIRLGDATNGDLQIYHDGANSVIADKGTGHLLLTAPSFRLRNDAQTEEIITADEDGAVKLYYDGSKRFETTSAGVTVTGDVTISANTPELLFADTDNNTDAKLLANNGNVGIFSDINQEYSDSIIYFNIDGTERARFDGNGYHFRPGADSTYDLGTNTVRWRNVYADTLYGDGSNLTGVAADESRTIILTVKNKSGGSLSKGTLVHASPSANPPSGNLIEVIAAENDVEASMPALGVLNETLADEAEGECVVLGRISGISTTDDGTSSGTLFSIGDFLYVSDTAGLFTNVKPTGTKLIQKIGIVIKTHATNGTVEIFGAGRTNDVPTPLYIDHANQRVGIGATSPGNPLHIYKNATIGGITSTTVANAGLRIQDSGANMYVDGNSFVIDTAGYLTTTGSSDFDIGTNSTSRIKIKGDGKVGIGTAAPHKKLEVTGDIQLDGTDANIWIKSGAAGTNGFINWTFNSNDTVYNKVGIDYDTRATTGFHIDAGYPITIDGVNNINFHLSGSSQGTWDSTGLGIGTSSPQTALQILSEAGTNVYDAELSIIDTRALASNTGGGIKFGGVYTSTGTTNADFGFIRVLKDNATSGNYSYSMAFGTRTNGQSPAERMRISSGGDVGIGGTNDGNSRLSVHGAGIDNVGGTANSLRFRFYNGTTFQSGMQAVLNTDEMIAGAVSGDMAIRSQSNMLFATGGNTERMRISSDGSVIFENTIRTKDTARIFKTGQTSQNTYSAVAGLQLHSQQSDSGSPYTKTSDIVANADGTVPSELRIFTKANGDSTPSERMRITSDGKVGIGETSPDRPFHVTSSSDTPILVESTDDTTGIIFKDNNSSNALYYRGNGNYFYTTSKFGIGTSSPDSLFHIESTADTSTPIFTIENDNAIKMTLGVVRSAAGTSPDTSFIAYDGSLRFIPGSGSATEKLTLDSSGNATFAGDVTVTGDLVVNGTETILNTETVEVEDNIIVLNKTNTSMTATTSGISVYRGASAAASFIFDDSDDYWDLTHNLKVAGTTYLDGFVTIDHNLDITSSGVIRMGGTEVISAARAINATSGTFLAKSTQLGTSGYYINSTFKDTGDNVGVFLAHNDTANGTGAIAGINQLAFLTYGSAWTQALLLDSNQNATFAGDITTSASNPFVTIEGNSSSYVNGGIQFITNHASSARGLGTFYYNAHTDVEWFAGLPYNGNDAFVINRNSSYTVPSSESSPAGIGASAGTLFSITSSGAITAKNDLTLDNSSPEIYFKTGASHYNWMIAAQENIDTALEFTPANAVGASGTHDTPALTLYANRAATFAGDIEATGSRTISAQYDSNHFMRLESNSSGGVLKGTDGGVTTILARSYGHTFFDGGNFGIGTGDNPAQKLTVNGATFITGALTSPGSAGSYTYNGTAVDYHSDGARYWSWGNATTRGTFSFIQLENDGQNQQTALSIDSSGDATFAGDVTATSKKFISTSSSSGDYIRLYAGSGTAQWDIYGHGENLRFSENSSGGGVVAIDSAVTWSGGGSANANTAYTYSQVGHLPLAGGTMTGDLFFNVANQEIRFTNDSNGFITHNVVGRDIVFKTSQSSSLDKTPLTLHGTGGGATFGGSVRVSTLSYGDPSDDSPLGSLSYGSDFVTLETNGAFPIRLKTNGANALTIDTSQNVGIGTTSPSKDLVINNTTGAQLQLQLNGADRFRMEADSFGGSFYSPSGYGARFFTSGSERMRITSDGDVAINVTNPSARLHVNSGTGNLVSLFQSTDAVGKIALFDNTTSNVYSVAIGVIGDDMTLHSGSSGSEAMRITSAGNVGIGTSSPFGVTANRTCFSVNGSTDVSLNVGTEGVQRAYLYSQGSYARLATIGTIPLTLGVNDSEKMRITSAGNVGIGTTSPDASLDIEPSSGDADILLTAGSQTLRLDQNSIRTTTNSDINIFTNGNLNQLFLDQGTGNVGVGNNAPIAKFEVSDGSSSITLQEYNNGATIFLDGSDGDFTGGDYFHIIADGTSYLGLGGYGGAATPLNVTNAGNVGIGTTTPNEKLVVGTTGGTQNIEIGNNFIQSFNRSASAGYQTLDFYASSYTFNNGNATFAGTVTADNIVKATNGGSEHAYLMAAATGTGVAGMYLDASNGDFSGGDYFSIVQKNDLSVEFESRANAGNLIFKSKGSTNLTMDGASSTFAGQVKTTAASGFIVDSTVDLSMSYFNSVPSTSWAIFTTNGHADTVISTNLKIDGNHDLVTNQTHSTIKGSGIVFTGNQHHAGAGAIAMYALGNGSATAGTVTAEESYALLIKDTGATFAGNVTVNGGQILTPGGVNLALNPNTGVVTVGGIIQCSGTGTSTFAGNVTLNSRLTFDYGGDHYFEAGTNSLAYKNASGSSIMLLNASTSAATFAGKVNVNGTPAAENGLLNVHAASGNSAIQITSGAHYVYLVNTATEFTIGSDHGTTGTKFRLHHDAPDDTLVIDSSGDATFKGSVHLDNDSAQLQLGDDNDMQIYHNGAVGEINNATGEFTIDSAGQINIDSGNAEIHLRGSGTTFGKLFTSGSNFYINHPTSDKDIIFSGNDGGSSITALTLDMSAGGNAAFGGGVSLLDSKILNIGTGNDLQIYHDGTHSYIANNTGELTITQNTDDGNIIFNCDDGTGGVHTYFHVDGGADRTIFSRSTRHNDNAVATFGTSEDLQIFHDGSHSEISESGTGDFRIRGDSIWFLRPNGTNQLSVVSGVVKLYYVGSQKLETTNTGVSVTGAMTASGEVTAFSDERLKSNIETLDGSKVYDMRGVSFTKDNKDGSGVIAQELEKVAPELVNNDSEYKSVAYGNITGYLIEAIKDLKAEIEELKKCECKNCNCK